METTPGVIGELIKMALSKLTSSFIMQDATLQSINFQKKADSGNGERDFLGGIRLEHPIQCNLTRKQQNVQFRPMTVYGRPLSVFYSIPAGRDCSLATLCLFYTL